MQRVASLFPHKPKKGSGGDNKGCPDKHQASDGVANIGAMVRCIEQKQPGYDHGEAGKVLFTSAAKPVAGHRACNPFFFFPGRCQNSGTASRSLVRSHHCACGHEQCSGQPAFADWGSGALFLSSATPE